MDLKTDQEISSENYISEMKNLIEFFENNVEYLKKEIEIKQRMLKLNEDSLCHEKQALDKYLKAK